MGPEAGLESPYLEEGGEEREESRRKGEERDEVRSLWRCKREEEDRDRDTRIIQMQMFLFSPLLLFSAYQMLKSDPANVL